VNSFNRVEIGRISADTKPGAGVTIKGMSYSADGKTLVMYSPHINYTANDLKSLADIIRVQIHELGHSLYYITGISPRTRSAMTRGDDEGVALERCVFGNRRIVK
jgi:hypothetical protein